MIYTGDTRSANSILAQQNVAISGGGKFENQKRMVKLAFDLKRHWKKTILMTLADFCMKAGY